jgi:hypothetical protein
MIYISESGISELWDVFEIPPKESYNHPSPRKCKRFAIDPFSPNLQVSKDQVIIIVSDQLLFDQKTWRFESKGYILNDSTAFSNDPDLKYAKPNTTAFTTENLAIIDLRFNVLKVEKPRSLEELRVCVNQKSPRIIYTSTIVAPILYKFLKQGQPIGDFADQIPLVPLYEKIKYTYTTLWYKDNTSQICLKLSQ